MHGRSDGLFNPNIFFDFATSALNKTTRPRPYLQVINLSVGLLVCLLEWPLRCIAGSSFHRSIIFRFAIIPDICIPAILMYQTHEPGVYYMIGLAIYAWAYKENEVWPLPVKRY